jgi:transposase
VQVGCTFGALLSDERAQDAYDDVPLRFGLDELPHLLGELTDRESAVVRALRPRPKGTGLSGGFKSLSGMAMGPAKGQAATLQVEMVCLDELVSVDDRLRRLDAVVDWGFVRVEAAAYYALDVGRPSIDPIVLVKLMLVGALEGVDSMRELLRVASMRVDIRRFLGYGFSERLPVHQTISHAQTRRFVDAQLFERLFLRSVALCREHGLIDGTHLSVDGFHVEADAALASLRASLAAVDDEGGVAAGTPDTSAKAPAAEGDGGGDVPAEPPERPQLVLAEPRSGPTPKRRSSNATSTSLTDPDAKLRGKPGQRPHLVHRGQIAVDPKTRCIVACLGETADGHEGDALVPLLERARFACPDLESVGADQGFAAERVWTGVAEQGVTAFVPPQRTMLPAADAEPKTDAQREAQAARQRCKTDKGVWAHGRRMADAEGGVAELKNEHGLHRARCRGTSLFHVQLLLGCAALNLKRITSRAPAAEGQAACPATGQTAAIGGDQAASAPTHDARAADAGDLGLDRSILLASPTAWTITLSLN